MKSERDPAMGAIAAVARKFARTIHVDEV